MIQRSRKSFKGECENGRLLSKQDLGLQCQTPLRFQYENFFCLKKILNSKNFGSEKISGSTIFLG